jgi:DNA-binding NarL/FixJ family response regulator
MRPMPSTIAQTVRILLIDDQVIVREGLRLLLESQTGFSVVSDAATAKEAIEHARNTQPDVILLDLDLGDSHGLTCLSQLLEVAPKAKVLILTGVYDLEVHHAAISSGAMGIVRKLEAGDVLVKAIRKVSAGEVWLDGVLMARVLSDLWTARTQGAEENGNGHSNGVSDKERKVAEMWRPKNSGSDEYEAVKIARLTEREREVVTLIGEGLRNQQIADRLCISVITVRHHLSSVFSKLEVGDRFELAIYSYRHGLAKPPM